ncbi:MAG: DUF4365 domain-containing protein, partial [Crenarchaeota archaeon]|nr:DUF4365 domain-containing protein [Thermoproteota archaeon]
FTSFGWIFREKTKRDVGIDAEIETKDGIIIQAQIKTGKSYFKVLKNKPSGLTFYTSQYHYNYWLNLKSPVIFLAHIPEDDLTYWQIISKENFQKSKSNWKLFIPFSQKLIPTQKELILDKIIKEPDIKVIYNPSNNNTPTTLTTETINMGRSRQLTKELLDELKNQILSKGLLYKKIDELKQKCYSNPTELNYRFELGKTYFALNERNNAIIEFSHLIKEIYENADNWNSKSNQMIWVLSRYYIDILTNSDITNFQEEILKARPSYIVKVNLFGKQTHLIKIQKVKFYFGKNPIDMIKFNEHTFFLPKDFNYNTIEDDTNIQIKPEFSLDIGTSNVSPELSSINLILIFGIIKDDYILDKYCITLI